MIKHKQPQQHPTTNKTYTKNKIKKQFLLVSWCKQLLIFNTKITTSFCELTCELTLIYFFLYNCFRNRVNFRIILVNRMTILIKKIFNKRVEARCIFSRFPSNQHKQSFVLYFCIVNLRIHFKPFKSVWEMYKDFVARESFCLHIG